MEEWRECVGYGGRYFVSNKGRVKSRKKFLVCGKTSHGYRTVSIMENDGTKCPRKYVHRFVAEAFIPNAENKPEVNHLDGNRSNNSLENLEWVTRKENLDHAVRMGLFDPKRNGGNLGGRIASSKFNDKTIKEIREFYSMGEKSVKELSFKYGINLRYCFKVVANQARKTPLL